MRLGKEALCVIRRVLRRERSFCVVQLDFFCVGNSQDIVPSQCAHLSVGLEYCGELWWDVNGMVGEGAAQAWHLNNQELSPTNGLYLHSNNSCHQPVVYIFTPTTAVTNQWFISSVQQQLSLTSGLYLHPNSSCH
jgi:hypothetical protein